MDDILWIDPDDISDQPGDVERMAVQLASYVLYSLTGRKFPGYKETTEWYCSDVADYSLAVSSLRHYLPQHLVHPITTEHRSSKFLTLTHRPIVSIKEVITSSGKQVEPYIVDNQSLSLPNNQDWNFSSGILVSYTYGQKPPVAGRIACAELARQIALIFSDNESDCQLNSRIVGNISSVQMQGVSYTTIDPQTFLTEGRTGITTVDLFIKSANPSGAKRPAKVIVSGEPIGRTFRR